MEEVSHSLSSSWLALLRVLDTTDSIHVDDDDDDDDSCESLEFLDRISPGDGENASFSSSQSFVELGTSCASSLSCSVVVEQEFVVEDLLAFVRKVFVRWFVWFVWFGLFVRFGVFIRTAGLLRKRFFILEIELGEIQCLFGLLLVEGEAAAAADGDGGREGEWDSIGGEDGQSSDSPR
jgi:hypothetical protein